MNRDRNDNLIIKIKNYRFFFYAKNHKDIK